MIANSNLTFAAIQQETTLGGSATGNIFELTGRTQIECRPVHTERRRKINVWRQNSTSAVAGTHWEGSINFEIAPNSVLEMLFMSILSLQDRVEGSDIIASFGLRKAGGPYIPGLKLLCAYDSGVFVAFSGVRVQELTVSCRAGAIVQCTARFVALDREETLSNPAWESNAVVESSNKCRSSDVVVVVGEGAEDPTEVSVTFRHVIQPSGLREDGRYTGYQSGPPIVIFGTLSTYYSETSNIARLVVSGNQTSLEVVIPGVSDATKDLTISLGAVVFEEGAPMINSRADDNWLANWRSVGVADVNPVVLTIPPVIPDDPVDPDPPATPVLAGEFYASYFSRLSWTVQLDCTHELQRSNNGGSSWSTINNLAAGIFAKDDEVPDFYHDFTYRVRATNAGGTSGWSNEVTLEWSLVLDLNARLISAGDGDKIGNWTDQSAHSHHAFQGTELRKPVFKSDFYGSGLHALEFHSTLTYDSPIPTSVTNYSQLLNLAQGWNIFDQGLTIMIVCSTAVEGGSRTLLSFGEGGANKIDIRHGAASDGLFNVLSGGSGVVSQSLTNSSQTGLRLLTVRLDGTDFDYWLNNNNLVTASELDLPSASSRVINLIGAAVQASTSGFDYIGQIKVWNRGLTDSEIVAKQYELFSDWGIVL